MLNKVLVALMIFEPLLVFAQDDGVSRITLPTIPSAATAPTDGNAPISAPTAPTTDAKAERIEVTGSHIRRIEAEGASPVTTVTRKEIQDTGYNAVADVIRDLSVNSFGSTREASGSNAAGNAEVNLRGLGSSNTLVLLDGQRLPPDAVTGAVDLNLIPLAAVERIEILKDGASAIYGSDALGGVVNIITRKDFSGSQVNLTESVPQMVGGRKTELNAVNGINTKKLNVVSVVQYRDNQAIYDKDRPWSNGSIFQGAGLSSVGSPGSYKSDGGKWNADPSCPAGMVITTASGSKCQFRYSDYSTALPAIQQVSGMSTANYELNSDVKLTGRLFVTQKRVQWAYAPAPGEFTIPAAVASTLGPGHGALPGATAGKDLTVDYRTLELGPRNSEIVTNAVGALAGATFQAPHDWQVDVTANHNIINTHMSDTGGYADQTVINNDISSGAFNPFGTGAARGSLANAQIAPLEETLTQISTLEAKASGDLGEFGWMKGGPLGVAIGTNMGFQKYSDSYDAWQQSGNVFGQNGQASVGGTGTRTTEAVFTELSAPLTKKLELQAAARFDHYSDFGSTVNPKLAFLYHATPSFLLRGSVGTGFKAPLMQDLFSGSNSGFPTFIDWVQCKKLGGNNYCQPNQWAVTATGNPNLQPEKSLSINFGAVYEPTSDFNLGADLFWAKLNNVSGLDLSKAMLAASNGIDLAKYGIIVTRDPSTGDLTNIYAPNQNLAYQQIEGIDLTASYRIHRVKLATDHSLLFYFLQEGFPGAGVEDILGENGNPAWRNTTTLSYFISDKHEASLAAVTIAGQAKSAGAGNLPNYTEFELHYAYKLSKAHAFNFGIRNLFAYTPPLDDSSPTAPLNTALYDQIGRQFIAAYSGNF